MSKNKKLLIILVLCIIVIGVVTTQIIIPCIKMYKEKQIIANATVKVDLVNNLDLSYYSDAKVSNLIADINGELVSDLTLNTKKIGTHQVTFEYINDENIKIPFTIKYNVVDNTPPVIWISSTYYVNIGTKRDFYKDILCGDDYDDNPTCVIEGNYDTSRKGVYNVEFVATDSSGNENRKPFKLYVGTPIVVETPTPVIEEPTEPAPTRTYFADVIKQYKTENTKIGIDVSGWQGVIDYEAVKNAGVEFVFIKVGGTFGINGEYYVDSKFKRNIEGFNKVGIPVGIYFYSYAPSKESAIADANWTYEQIKDYKVDLPVVYDWENWSFYNEFNLSFANLTKNAEAYLDVLNEKGYDGLLYSSRNYLDKIWLPTKYPKWVAHYTTDKTVSYEQYDFWQLCDNGQIDGIYGNVDIDIMYVKE